MLGSIVLDPMFLALCGVTLLCAVLLGGFFYRKDNEIEERRKKAADISAYFKGIGMSHTSAFFRDYSVGDYDGMWVEAKAAIGILENETQRNAQELEVAKRLAAEVFKDGPAAWADLLNTINKLNSNPPTGATSVAVKPAAPAAPVAVA